MENPKKSIPILQITDNHLFADPENSLLGINTRHTFDAVLKHARLADFQPERILVTGDIAQDGNLPAYQYFLQEISKWQLPVHSLPGNHDLPARLKTSLGSQTEPVTDCGAWRIVLLDTSVPNSEGGYLADSQLEILENAATTTDKHILLAIHHNPVPMGSKWLDTMQVGNSAELFKLIDRLSNIKTIIWGHVHQEYDSWYTTAKGLPIRLLATPSTCFQFLPHSTDFALDLIMPGYRRINLHPDGTLDTEVIRIPELPHNAGQLSTTSSGY